MFETSGAAGYSHLGSVVWAGQGSVGFTPGAGRGSGRAVVRQCAGRARSTAGQGRAVGVINAGLRFGISGSEKKGETIAVNMEFE